MAFRPSRHVACTRCRERKVKCDGRKPWCRRCSGSGKELLCSYDTRPPKALQQNVSFARENRDLNVADKFQQSQQRLDQIENYQDDMRSLLLHLIDKQQPDASNELSVIDNNNDVQPLYLDELAGGGGGGQHSLYPIDLTYPVAEASTSIAMQPMQQINQISPSVEEFQQLLVLASSTMDQALINAT